MKPLLPRAGQGGWMPTLHRLTALALFTLPACCSSFDSRAQPETNQAQTASPASPTGTTAAGTAENVLSGINPALANSQGLLSNANVRILPASRSPGESPAAVLESALKEKRQGKMRQAEELLVSVLEKQAPDEVHKRALLELAVLAHEQQQLVRAQQIYGQFLKAYPGDPSVPEILLRQGLVFRQMGAPVMALSKFYSVMSTALNLKLDRLEYYQRLVLQAQSEIAETYYVQGKYEEASEFFGRLLKLENRELDKATILYKLVRSLSLRGRHAEVVVHAQAYLDAYPEAAGAPEVRFIFADALKKLGRNREAMQQVVALLQPGEASSSQRPEEWLYWQRRAANDVANQLYQEGDYVNALEIYLKLATLNNSPDWQFPAFYQLGLIYERLQQPEKALEAYGRIVQSPPSALPLSAGSSAVLDMAKWRVGYLRWERRASESSQQLTSAARDQPLATP